MPRKVVAVLFLVAWIPEQAVAQRTVIALIGLNTSYVNTKIDGTHQRMKPGLTAGISGTLIGNTDIEVVYTQKGTRYEVGNTRIPFKMNYLEFGSISRIHVHQDETGTASLLFRTSVSLIVTGCEMGSGPTMERCGETNSDWGIGVGFGTKRKLRGGEVVAVDMLYDIGMRPVGTTGNTKHRGFLMRIGIGAEL